MAQFNNIPSNVLFALNELEKAGYEAYLVGGCVRDMAADKIPHDYDIATSAKPEEVTEVFSTYTVVPTGIKHGTVTVILEDDAIEVTTYRIDGEYSDGRHPTEVQFVTSLEEDLSRRDFTINAIAYQPRHGKVVDPFGGLSDLAQRRVKAVGDPNKRFQEDALRIMRMFRFYLMQGSKASIDANTMQAACDCMDGLTKVSPERIHDELNKIVLLINRSNYLMPEVIMPFQRMLKTVIPEITDCIGFAQNNPYHDLSVFSHSIKALAMIDKEARQALPLKLALLLHDIAKPRTATMEKTGIMHFYHHASKGAEMAKEIMQRLRYDNYMINKVVELIQYHDCEIPKSRAAVNRLANKLHYNDFVTLMQMRWCDIMAQNALHPTWAARLETADQAAELYGKMQKEGEVFSLKNLAIDGNDVLSLGVLQGAEVGMYLNVVLSQVVSGCWANERDILLKHLKTLVEESKNETFFC